MKFHPLLKHCELDLPQWNDRDPEQQATAIEKALEYDPSMPSNVNVCLRCHSTPTTPFVGARAMMSFLFDIARTMKVGVCTNHPDHPVTQAEIDWIENYKQHLLLMVMYLCADEYDSVVEVFDADLERAYLDITVTDAHNRTVLEAARNLDASNWRDVAAAARHGMFLDLNVYFNGDPDYSLPFLSILAHYLMCRETDDPGALDVMERQLAEVEGILTDDPALPWELVAAWTGITTRIPAWVLRSGSTTVDPA